MGCDGGTIPRRDELVRLKKKPESKDKDSELVFQWRCCALTQQLLQSPIVTCGLGKLYNKLSLIEALLNKDAIPETISHVKTLKDIKELNLTCNPIYNKDDDTKERAANVISAPYICPVIGLEMTGKFRFIALWSCGCVFSDRALKEIATKVCHKCQKPFVSEDVVILNGNEEDIILMKEQMANRQLKLKKRKDKKIKVETIETSSVEEVKEEIQPGKDLIKTVSAESTSNGKRSGKIHDSEMDTKKMKSDYSVAKDPQVSDVYKSLFTTHKSEKEQTRAHWITYNPFYN